MLLTYILQLTFYQIGYAYYMFYSILVTCVIWNSGKKNNRFFFVCVEVLRPSQPNGVMQWGHVERGQFT